MTTKGPKQIMILTGEPSGDLHAGSLMDALKKLDPKCRISGIGGPCMKARGGDVFFPIERLSAMGLTEVVLQLRTISQAFGVFKSRIRSHRPDLLILIDYPGFNLRAARFAKEKYKIPVFYYITPKVWAWKESRLNLIKKYVDHSALIFPFEPPLYKKYKIPASYVGNPLMDEYPDHLIQSKPLLDPGKEGPVIGLLPGSRKAEIKNLLQIMLESARIIQTRHANARFLVSAASDLHLGRIEKILQPHNKSGCFKVVKGAPINIFKASDMLIAASGTVTLEAALSCLPTILIYKMSPLSYRVGRLLVKVKYAGLANIIAGQEVMPELLQDDATPEKISARAFSMLKDLEGYKFRLLLVRKLLGSPGASNRAARIAIDICSSL